MSNADTPLHAFDRTQAGDSESPGHHMAANGGDLLDVDWQPDALTALERDNLSHQESVIQRGLKTFVDVGLAFAEIRRSRLYREVAATFEDYCRVRWGISDSRARQFILGAVTALQIETVTAVTLPNEAVARSLRTFDFNLQPVIVQTAQARYGRLTAGNVASVGRVVEEMTRTGHVDTGSGRSTAVEAALTAEDEERYQRQRQHIDERQQAATGRELIAILNDARVSVCAGGLVTFHAPAEDVESLGALEGERTALIVKVYRTVNPS